ncbi:DUF924 family protein [Tabrizicola sp. DMG-N-6]|uniref:DUF924 family protein n=1 Tax=Szabonella alba TaxID=2804194 RepID=A0A8K0V9T3_9RHOB|nr:DUF924 family protein [Szabonella alba]
MPVPGAGAVVDYWHAAGDRGEWFSKRPGFDRDFRDRFQTLHETAAEGGCDGWIATPEGALALMILLDQFPRNAFRGTARMYATDARALPLAREAEKRGHWSAVEPDLRLFLALPFSHSETLADQDISVRLNTRLGQPWLSHAEGHRDIIGRFGRFPHRNAILGRETTPEEARFLRKGGFRG